MPRLLNPFARPMRTTDYYGSGDANLDGIFDHLDLQCAEAIIARDQHTTERADVNGDGGVNAEDITLMQEVLSGSRSHLPGWWEHLETRGERNAWIDRMLAADETDRHPYEAPYFLCRNFSGVLVLNNIGYDGSFHGEPSQWITPGRFNLPLCQVILASLNHAITAVLVGDDPRQFDSWRFIEPQSDSEGQQWFRPGERIYIQASSHFSALGELSSARSLVIFELDENGDPQIEHVDPDLLITRLGRVNVFPRAPDLAEVVHFTTRVLPEEATDVRVLLRRAGSEVAEAEVHLYDDGAHDDGEASDRTWGGSTTVTESANVIVDLATTLADGTGVVYQQASWFTTADGRWNVSPSGSDSNPGSGEQPFRTIHKAVETAFPGDTILVAPGLYSESLDVDKGKLRIRGTGTRMEDVVIADLRTDYGTGIEIHNLCCQFAGVYHASDPSFSRCRVYDWFETADALADLKNCHLRQMQAWNASVVVQNSLISNPDGSALTIHCAQTTTPELVVLRLLNCTIVDSETGIHCTAGDGDYPCTLNVANCILWGNTCDLDSDYPQISLRRCDIESEWIEEGDNISLNPRFADPSTGDYRLLAGSPCVDAGDNSVLSAPGLDLGGNLRIANGEHSLTVDMGAYEYNSRPFAIIQVICSNDRGLRLVWNSQPFEAYTVWSCGDSLTCGWREEVIQPSSGETTLWTDDSGVNLAKFYRVEMENPTGTD